MFKLLPAAVLEHTGDRKSDSGKEDEPQRSVCSRKQNQWTNGR